MEFKALWELWNPLSKAVPEKFNRPGRPVYKTVPVFTRLGHGKLSQFLTLQQWNIPAYVVILVQTSLCLYCGILYFIWWVLPVPLWWILYIIDVCHVPRPWIHVLSCCIMINALAVSKMAHARVGSVEWSILSYIIVTVSDGLVPNMGQTICNGHAISIDQSHKSCDELDQYPTMQPFVTAMCIHCRI